MIKKHTKGKFQIPGVRDWIQENRLHKKMCKYCGDNPPNNNSDYCSESCAKSGLIWEFSE